MLGLVDVIDFLLLGLSDTDFLPLLRGLLKGDIETDPLDVFFASSRT